MEGIIITLLTGFAALLGYAILVFCVYGSISEHQEVDV